jgi:hypothetical protein
LQFTIEQRRKETALIFSEKSRGYELLAIWSFHAIHKSIQFGMDKFAFGRSVQSLPNVIINRVYNVHPNENQGFRDNLQIQWFVCSHSFSPLVTPPRLADSLSFSNVSFPSLFQPLNYDQYSRLRYHYNSNHPRDLTPMKVLELVCFRNSLLMRDLDNEINWKTTNSSIVENDTL